MISPKTSYLKVKMSSELFVAVKVSVSGVFLKIRNKLLIQQTFFLPLWEKFLLATKNSELIFLDSYFEIRHVIGLLESFVLSLWLQLEL